MPDNPLSIDDIVAIIKRSSLPTVVVEGRQDMEAYRWIEHRFGVGKADILPCGGRSKLLAVFGRRTEFPTKKVAFLADRDMWLFTAIPVQYRDVIWTSGYCIENDILAGSDIEKLMTAEESTRYERYWREVARWLAFEIELHRAGQDYDASHGFSTLFPDTSPLTICPIFLASRGYVPATAATLEEIVVNYKLKLRGKTLFELLSRIMCARGRSPQFGASHFFNIGTMTGNNHYLSQIATSIGQVLN